jgi:hypothetical protein
MKLDGCLIKILCYKLALSVVLFSGKHCLVGVSLCCLVENFLCHSFIIQWKMVLLVCM